LTWQEFVGEHTVRFQRALDTFSKDGLGYCLRDHPATQAARPPTDDIDVVVLPEHLARAESILASHGFARYRVSGHPGHRFWVGVDGGESLKLDVMTEVRYPGVTVTAQELISRREYVDNQWFTGEPDRQFHAQMRLRYGKVADGPARGLGRSLDRLRASLPVAVRRTGPVIAVLGPDGAGKGTTISNLQALMPIGVNVCYLGLGSGRASAETQTTAVPEPAKRPPHPVREGLYLTRNACRWWVKLLRVYALAWTGRPVVCDRHPVELLATDNGRTASGHRVEQVLFGRLTPRPDTVVLLDAPGAVMFARKGEHDPVQLENRRQEYRQFFLPRQAVLISTAGSAETSASELAAVVWAALGRRQRWDHPGVSSGALFARALVRYTHSAVGQTG
jgi:thymidylate kinase